MRKNANNRLKLLRGMEGNHDVFGLGADAELAAPNAETATDVVAGGASLPGPEGAFVESIGQP